MPASWGGKEPLPTEWSVRKVWLRVCADIAAEVADQGSHEVRQATVRSKPTKRRLAAPDHAKDTSVGRRASPPPAAPVPAQQGDEHLSERVRAQLAAVDEQFAYLDRHIIRPKQRT